MTATSESAKGQLGWPSAEEVRLITDIINPLGKFDKMPTFLKERRGTTRAITMWDLFQACGDSS